VAGVLDEEAPWIVRQVISLLSSRVYIDDEVSRTLREISARGPVVYALKYRSVHDLLFLRMRFAALGLPVPAYVFDVSTAASGSLGKATRVWRTRFEMLLRGLSRICSDDRDAFKEILDGGGAGVLFLVDEKTSRKRYVTPESDPVRILLDLQGKTAASISMVPMTILYDRTRPRTIRPFWESFLGDPDRPGPLKRLLIALRKWTVPELLIGEPVYLVSQFEEFGSDLFWEDLPFEVRARLTASVNERIRINRGPERLSRTEMKELVLQDARVQKAVGETVTKENTSEASIRKKAEAYVDEIAADQRIQVMHFLYYLLKWLLSTVFDGVDLRESDFANLKKSNAAGSLVFVPCHKSHFDGLLVGYFAFVNQMAVPYIAAGKNLAFWPVGSLLRNVGAFFIRRSFTGLVLYTHVFAAYLKVLVKEKININFYIEGGRSRTGKLLPPRVGMLTFLVRTIEQGAVDDLQFVPTFVGYDQIPDENAYLRELAGREKQAESVSAMIRARDILKKRFGKVYVRFHEPVSFREFMKKAGVQGEPGTLSLKQSRKLLNDFAFHLMKGIVKAGVVSPTEVTAAGLVCSGRLKVTHGFLIEACNHLSTCLRHEGTELADRLDNRETALGTALGLFKVRGFLDVEASPEPHKQILYVINPQKRANLEFYKNSLVNYLWPSAVLATVLLTHDVPSDKVTDDVKADFAFIRQMFSKELIFDPLVTDEQLVESSFDFFCRQGWVNPGGEMNRVPLDCLRGLVADMFEVYYLVLAAAGETGRGGVYQKDLVKRMAPLAQEIHSGTEQSAIPSFPSVTVANALTKFSEMRIVEYRQSKGFLKGVSDPDQREKVMSHLGRALRNTASLSKK